MHDKGRFVLHLVRSLNIFHGVSQNQQCCHCTAVKHPGCEAKEINQSKDVSQQDH